MNNFYLVVNTDKKDAEAKRTEVRRYLAKRGASCFSSERVYVKGRRFTELSDVPPETECVITLGGDGTFIRASRDFASRNIPIFGINIGELGYLTGLGANEDLEHALDCLMSGQFRLEERMMLRGVITRGGKTMTENIALNDIILSRAGDMRVLSFEIQVNGQVLSEYSADGMIVSTPTGSTAYNLSAGGPIAQPDSQLMILTPICSHTLSARSVILGADNRVTIRLLESNYGSQSAVFDGDTYIPLEPGDEIAIERSRLTTRIVKLDHQSFLGTLKSKLAFR